MRARKWLSDIRGNQGLKQKDVARKVGINTHYYAQIEQGLRNPSVNVAKRIASVLGFDWTIFFEDNCSDMLQNENKTTA